MFRSIKKLFIVLMSGSAILAALAIGITILNSSSKAISLEAQQSMLHLATKTAFDLDRQAIKIETLVSGFRSVVERTFDVKKALDEDYYPNYDKLIAPIIKNIAEKNQDGMNAYLWFDPSFWGRGHRISYANTRQDGVATRNPSILDDKHFNPNDPEMAWYYDPIRQKKGVWSGPYYWEQYKSVLITYAEPIIVEDKLIGVFGIDAYFHKYKEAINRIRIYKTGRASILNRHLSFMAHKEYGQEDTLSTLKNGTYLSLYQKIRAMDSGVMTINNSIFAFAHLKNGNTILIEAPKNEVLDKVIVLRGEVILLMLLIIPGIIGIAWWASRRISKPIIAATHHAQAIADGDFQVALPDFINNRKDEIGILGRSLQTMTNKLKALITKLTEANHELEISLKQLNANEEQLRRQYEEIKRTENELRQYKTDLENLVKKRTQELITANDELKMFNRELTNKNEIIHQTNMELNEAFKALKDAQYQLIQAEKMASLGILTAGVAHEINNPLNYLMGALIALKDYFEENGSQDEQQTTMLLSSIETGIDRISSIVKGLNQFSRNNNSQNEDCEIHTIINNCLTILQNQTKHKITIHRNYYIHPLLITGNAGRLHQAFLNILNNAIQAIPEKGNVHIYTTLANNKALIEIKDDGIGIEKENLPHVTDPFFTTKPPGIGTGLGLSITQAIVKEHTGQMMIVSEINQGTKVTMTFPVISPQN